MTGDGQEHDRLLAAHWQHEIVLLVHDALAYKGKTVTWLAAQTRMGADNLWRLMRGVGPMKVEDFAALSCVLNVYFVHPPGAPLGPPISPTPRRGPRLDGAGRRNEAKWERWVAGEPPVPRVQARTVSASQYDLTSERCCSLDPRRRPQCHD